MLLLLPFFTFTSMWLSLITRSCVIHFLLLINIFLLFKLNEFITYVFYGLYIGIKCSKRVDGNNKTSWRMAPYLLKIRRQRVAVCLPMKISRKVAPYLQMKKRWGVAVSSDKEKLKGGIISSDEKETKSTSISADGNEPKAGIISSDEWKRKSGSMSADENKPKGDIISWHEKDTKGGTMSAHKVAKLPQHVFWWKETQ